MSLKHLKEKWLNYRYRFVPWIPVKLVKVVLNKMPTGESDKMEDLNERIESFNRELKQGYL
jgi:hypothetical protein